MIPVQLRLDYGVTPQKAPIIAGMARKSGSRFLASAPALATVAEAELKVGNFPRALANADRALAFEPGNVHAMLVKARTLIAVSEKDSASAKWDEVRTLLIKANRADTENAEPLMLFYKSFVDAGAQPTDSAVKGLLYALVLAPQDGELRMMVVRQHVLDGKLSQAKEVLAPFVSGAHAERSRSSLGQLIDAIDAGDRTRATQLVNRMLKEASDET
jgi:Tfp pilus assembly protein PilF